MKRREFLRFAAAGLVSLPRGPQAVRQAAGRPNILFIFTDQQSAGMMSCAGNRYLHTPAMDSLARSGARFELAYSANPVCVPARFSMMTGVMPSRIGMEENSDIRKEVSPGILRHALGRIFRDAGYETAYGGKVHLPMTIEQAGFATICKDQRAGLAEACAEFLAKKHDRPFLLVASFINPHDICYMAIHAHDGNRKPPSRDLDTALELPAGKTRREFFDTVCPPLPPNFEVPEGEPEGAMQVDPRGFRFHVRRNWTEEDWRLHRWAYCRLTERVDAEIGRVLQALRAAGLEENTLIVFSSDHGDMDGAHRLEHKSILYEEAQRVPFLVSLKGVIPAGLVDGNHLVSTGLDLIPTLCDFAGISPPAGLAGRSVRPLAEGRKPEAWRGSLVVESHDSRAIRTKRYKYTVYGAGALREVLVDLERDPGEMKNLAQDPGSREMLLEHRRLLREWYHENGGMLPARYSVSGR